MRARVWIAAYLLFIGVLHWNQLGIYATYLTLPAWLVVGNLVALLPHLSPDVTSMLTSWRGNLVLLTASAVLNVALFWTIFRWRGRTSVAMNHGGSQK